MGEGRGSKVIHIRVREKKKERTYNNPLDQIGLSLTSEIPVNFTVESVTEITDIVTTRRTLIKG